MRLNTTTTTFAFVLTFASSIALSLVACSSDDKATTPVSNNSSDASDDTTSSSSTSSGATDDASTSQQDSGSANEAGTSGATNIVASESTPSTGDGTITITNVSVAVTNGPFVLEVVTAKGTTVIANKTYQHEVYAHVMDGKKVLKIGHFWSSPEDFYRAECDTGNGAQYPCGPGITFDAPSKTITIVKAKTASATAKSTIDGTIVYK